MNWVGHFGLSLLLISLSYSVCAFGQEDTVANQTLFEKISGLPKCNRLPKVDLNTRIAFHSVFSGSTTEKSVFRLDYLRLEVNGEITDRIYYKWLQHLNRSNRPGQLDNMPSSIDCLGVGFRITSTLSTFIGKQYADFGGFEYDANPAEVYEYSDLGNEITCFLVGANLSWWFTPTQEIRFQIVDGHSENADETYGPLPERVEAAKAPLGYTLNWNGNFLNERLLTRCSFSLFHEGEQQNVYFLALAAAWIQERFNMYVDVMYSAEDIDKLGIISGITYQEDHPIRAQHSGYLSLVSRVNYRIFPKLNVFAKGMYETAEVRKANGTLESGKYRTTWGYQGGVEYYPMKENLHFFALYRGKKFNYSTLGKDYQPLNEHPQSFSLGLIYKIPIL